MPKRAKPVRPPPPGDRPKNKLLASLPRADYERLRPHLKTIPVKVKHVFHPLNAPVREVFFPNGGVASITPGRRRREGSHARGSCVGSTATGASASRGVVASEKSYPQLRHRSTSS